MDAYISGSAGHAAIIKGTTAELYQIDKVAPVILKKYDVEHIFAASDDVIFIKNTDKRAVIKKLQHEANKSNCLIMFLTILNSSIERDSKVILAKHLNHLFSVDTHAYEFVCNIMFARPLPDDSIKSTPFNSDPAINKVSELLQNLFNLQHKVTQCSRLFSELCKERSLTSAQSQLIEGILVNQNFFFNFATQQADQSFLQNIHFHLLDRLKASDIKDAVHLAASLRTQFTPLVKTKMTVERNHHRLVQPDFEDSQEFDRQTKPKKVNNHDVYLQVQAQLSAIKKHLKSQNIAKAKHMTEQLISKQIKAGDNEFAAQSLCQISEFAKKLGLFELQLEWALDATTAAPLDYRTFGHVADAYINLENIDEASRYFEKCLNAHDENKIYGLTGLARIERIKCDSKKAMEYIEAAIENGGDTCVPYLIKAELLRDQWHYNESIKIYDFACSQFPEVVMAQCGRAAVFAEQKKFEEAESAYRLILKNYPHAEDKRFALSGLGFLLGRLGRFKEAHELLDQSISLSPYEDIVPLLSKIKVLNMEGRHKEAERSLVSLLKDRPQFVEVTEQLLELYLNTNEFDKAQKLFENANENIKEASIIQVRYSQLLRHGNNYPEALRVIDKLRSKKPKYILAMIERAVIFKMQGRLRQAKTQYEEVISVNKFDRTAIFGLQAISHIFNEPISVDCALPNVDITMPQTIEDYQTIGNMGLLKLSKGETKEGKKLLLISYNSKFKSLKMRYSTGLSMASLMLNQQSAALKVVKKSKTIIDYIQKIIIYGIKGDTNSVKQNIQKIDNQIPPFTNRIIYMVNQKFLTAANDDPISNEDIYQEQLKNMLIAA